MTPESTRLVTKSDLKTYFSALGISPGQTLLLHVSVKSIGWLVGGPQIIIMALTELLGPEGSLMMYVGWEDSPYTMEGWSAEKKDAYLRECPPFDPETSRAVVEWSILAEMLRNWPGAKRSRHPDGSFCAIGKHASFLTENHSLTYGYGLHSPLAKLTSLGGKVAMIGAPLNTVTLLHHAEDRANIPGKRVVKYHMPIRNDGGETKWVEVEEFNTSDGVLEGYNGDYFLDLMTKYIGENHISSGKVGNADCYLFDASQLHAYATNWMEQNLNRKPS